MSGARSRRKGATGELELASVLSAAGFPASRGQQHRGGPGSPDVLCPALPDIHFEVKRAERFNLYDALSQARADADVGQIPVVAHRRNHCEWVAVLRLEDFLGILRESSLVSPSEEVGSAEGAYVDPTQAHPVGGSLDDLVSSLQRLEGFGFEEEDAAA